MGSGAGRAAVPVGRRRSRQVHRQGGSRCPAREFDRLHHGRRSGFRDRPGAVQLAGTHKRVEQIRTMEIADYATYDGEIVMAVGDGLRQPADQPGLLFQPGTWPQPGDGDPHAGRRSSASNRRDHREFRTSRAGARRTSTSQSASSKRAPRPCASRSTAWSAVAVVVVEHVTRVRGDLRPTGPSRPSPAGSYRWRSPASRPTPSTSAHQRPRRP